MRYDSCATSTLATSLSLSHVRAHTLLPPSPFSRLKISLDLTELTRQKAICKYTSRGPAMSPGRGIGDVPQVKHETHKSFTRP